VMQHMCHVLQHMFHALHVLQYSYMLTLAKFASDESAPCSKRTLYSPCKM